MDFLNLSTVKSASEGAKLHLRHPGTNALLNTTEGTPVTIMLRGVDAPEFQAERKAILNRRLNSGILKGKLKMSADEMENDALDLLVKCTTDWEGIELGGPLPFSAENAKKLYLACPWVREQADAFTEDRANFLGNS